MSSQQPMTNLILLGLKEYRYDRKEAKSGWKEKESGEEEKSCQESQNERYKKDVNC